MSDQSAYDVFLSHNNADKLAVEDLARRLEDEARLRPFLDRWHLIPGDPWQEAIEEALRQSRTCAVFTGPQGISPWENEEMRAAIEQRVADRGFRVIPVLLPGAERGERGRLPAFLTRATWVEFRESLEEDEAFRRLVAGIKGIAPGRGLAEAAHEGVCPYRGLQVFEEEHARFFFGREAATEWLVNELRGGNRFLAVVGPSGSGKSSLVRAGLIPALQRGDLPGSDGWSLCILRPGHRPLENLAVALTQVLGSAGDPTGLPQLMDALTTDRRQLHLTVRLADAPAECRVALVVDQFEEIFTLCRDEGQRGAFVDNLLYASAIEGGRAVAVLTMRADFYGKCAAYPELAARVTDHQMLVSPMVEEELYQAIERPAQLVGLKYDSGLVDTLLREVQAEPGGLPLLEHTLLELWERREGRRLTFAAYREIGGVQGAIAHRAESIYADFDAEEKAITRRVVLRLTQPGEGTEDTRRRATLAELLPAEGDAADVETVVQALADARLLTTGQGERGDEIVDVAHEALIRGWPRLRRWIDADRAALHTHRRLTETAREWEENKREVSYLYSGARLAEAEEFATVYAADLSQLEGEFLDASIQAQEARRITVRRRTQRIIAGLVAGLVIISVLAIFAWGRSQLAERRRVEAEDAKAIAEARRLDAEEARADAEQQAAVALSRQLAAQSTNELDRPNYELALLLAIEAGRRADTLEAFAAIRQAFTLRSRTLLILDGHTGAVTWATWNADNSKILTVSDDGKVRVWDANSGTELVTLVGHWFGVRQASWSADSSRILTASDDGTARVWDAESGATLVSINGHKRGVRQAAWSPNEMRIVTASEDDTARVWDAESGAELVILVGHTDNVNQASWNADGTRILTASDDGTARVWNAETGEELLILAGHESKVLQASWNRTETRILTASEDGTARMWNAETGAELITFVHDAVGIGINQASWNADETRILTASDRTARVWDAETGEALLILSGHESKLLYASWSVDGSRILTTGCERINWPATDCAEGTARVWDAESGTELHILVGHKGGVNQASWSADETRILTASRDGTARVWLLPEGASSAADAAAAAELPILADHESQVTGASWNVDGSPIILTINDKGTARVWDADSGDELVSLVGHTGRAWASWIGDGSRILTAGWDETARVWDAHTGAELLTLTSDDGQVVWGGWSVDGSRILTASRDGKVWVRDAQTGAKLLTLVGHEGQVNQASWSADGSRILTDSNDGTARVWDAQTGIQLLTLTGRAAQYDEAHWSADTSRILTAIWDGTARVWDADTGAELVTLSGHNGAVNQVSWNVDETRILTASNDGTARVWDAQTGVELLKLAGHTRSVWQASWNTDETRILTASEDGTARVWDAETGAELAVLSGIWADWNGDGTRILTISGDVTVRQWYARMEDLIKVACQRAPRNMTQAEWRQFIKNEPHRATCPDLPVEEEE